MSVALLALANLSVIPNQRNFRSGSSGAYFAKYANMDLAIARAKATTGHDVGVLARFPGRLFSMLDFVEWGERFGYRQCNSLLILHPDPELQLVSSKCRRSATVRSFVDGYDLHKPLQTSGHDLAFFFQTLEHLYDPVLGLRMIKDALAPGGFVFTSVPALNHVHMEPVFYTMPSPWGLAMWCALAGLQVVAVGQYGSLQNIENIAKHTTWWPQWRTYYDKDRNPQIVNDHQRPCDVWVLAKRPAPLLSS